MSIKKYSDSLQRSGLRIHDEIDPTNEELWIPINDLEFMLKSKLIGMPFKGLPLRTRSKVIKSEICKILGYPIPITFKKTKPRFFGQQFDVYIQKSNNLQIWNEQIDEKRRYVIIKLSDDDIIIGLRVFTGLELSKLDKTGTLTQKYQARLTVHDKTAELIAEKDTKNILPLLCENTIDLGNTLPIELPKKGEILPIKIVFSLLLKLLNTTFPDAGIDQERNRGAELHQIVCKTLGYKNYHDDGKFPDIKQQLLEIKLQTSPTIDLGLVRPDSHELLSLPKVNDISIRHCDIRYALFFAHIVNNLVTIKNIYLTTGEAFFNRFPQFQGKVINKKLQIPLSETLFE